jgi:hypothetical protein
MGRILVVGRRVYFSCMYGFGCQMGVACGIFARIVVCHMRVVCCVHKGGGGLVGSCFWHTC